MHGETIKLTKNYKGIHHDNGGNNGFDRFNWTPCLNKTVVSTSYKLKLIDNF